ncbi:MAG: hypothetical protein LBN02_10375 [Oscillospiraceae bacterium]|jgi:hypothetical protein|nr:hypothetical protein [Oscillospiraceae bacterium]
MAKNIEVVDEHGVSYGVTYPKRAKGLVKNGRARWENDTKIILARPPEHLTEDIMSDNTNNVTAEQPKGFELPKQPEFTPIPNTAAVNPPDVRQIIKPPESAAIGNVTPADILQRIDAIIADTEHLKNAMAKLSGVYNEVAGGEQSHAIGNVVLARETTNQRLISLLEKMYDDARPAKPAPDMRKAWVDEQEQNFIKRILDDPDEYGYNIEDVMKLLRGLRDN